MPKLGAASAIVAVAWLGLWLADASPFGSINRGSSVSRTEAVAIDSALICLFGLQHSLMARPFWKRRFPGHERSRYLIATAVALAVLFTAWCPLPELVWTLPSSVRAGAMAGVVVAGWAVKELGARPFLGLRPIPAELKSGGPYRFLRHPIAIGTLLAFWCVPRMTEGHLLFSTAMSAYTIAGTWLETRDLRPPRVA